jgi:pSer/pThr/pTyr-binding forkhead associated (FHA) protein
LVLALALLGLLSLGAARLALSAKGRARVREAFTRSRGDAMAPARPATPSPPVAPPATRPLLRGVSGPYAGMEIPLGAEPVAIGRDPALANVVIPAKYPGVSKRHLLVHLDPRRGFLLEDCWSTNGSFLADGQPLPAGQPFAVDPGTRFYLGTPELMFEVVRQ